MSSRRNRAHGLGELERTWNDVAQECRGIVDGRTVDWSDAGIVDVAGKEDLNLAAVDNLSATYGAGLVRVQGAERERNGRRQIAQAGADRCGRARLGKEGAEAGQLAVGLSIAKDLIQVDGDFEELSRIISRSASLVGEGPAARSDARSREHGVILLIQILRERIVHESADRAAVIN